MSKEKPTKHFYAIVPNRDAGHEECYMVHWGTLWPTRNIPWCRVPISYDQKTGICCGVQETLETAVAKAKAISKGRYDIVLFRRRSQNPEHDAFWQFVPDRWIADGSVLE